MSNAFNPLNIGKTINKSLAAPFKYTPSIISKDLLVKGELIGDGLLEVEGKILGNVDGGVVTIRESAFVEGDFVVITGQMGVWDSHIYMTPQDIWKFTSIFLRPAVILYMLKIPFRSLFGSSSNTKDK